MSSFGPAPCGLIDTHNPRLFVWEGLTETTFIEATPTSSLPASQLDDVNIRTLRDDFNNDNKFQELESCSESDSDQFLQDSPKSNLGLSLCSLLCFCPIGLAAVYLSHQTLKSLSRGDLLGASTSSRRSLFLAVLSITIGTGVYVGVAMATIAYLSRTQHW